MSVVLSVQETGPCRKQLKVEIPAAAVDAETAQVVREWGRKTRLPGFRKGHVPPAVVRRRFKEDIEREVVDRLLPAFWQQAKTESDLDPLAPPEVEEVGTLADGEPLTFVATVEVRPPITLGDLDGFELPDPALEPTAEEIAEALDELRRRVADWRDAERPAARGDRVTVEIVEIGAGRPAEAAEAGGAEADGEGEAAAGGEPQTVTLEVGDPGVWEEMSLAVTGLGAGQEGRFSRRPAEGDARRAAELPGEGGQGGGARPAPPRRCLRRQGGQIRDRWPPSATTWSAACACRSARGGGGRGSRRCASSSAPVTRSTSPAASCSTRWSTCCATTPRR